MHLSGKLHFYEAQLRQQWRYQVQLGNEGGGDEITDGLWYLSDLGAEL